MKLSLVLLSAAAVIASLSQGANATITSAKVTFNQDIVTNNYFAPSRGQFYSFSVKNLLDPSPDARQPGPHEAKCELNILSETDGGKIPKGSTLTYDINTNSNGVDQHDWTWVPSYGGFFSGGWYSTTVGFSGRMVLEGRYDDPTPREQDVTFNAHCSIIPGDWAVYGTQFWLPTRSRLIRLLKPYFTYTETRK